MKIFLLAAFFAMLAQSALADNTPRSQTYTNRLSLVHHSTMLEKFNAIESAELRISLDNDLNGFVEGKVCDTCKEMRLIITPETKAYANRKEVPLKKAEARTGRYATIIYDLKTNQVSAIRW